MAETRTTQTLDVLNSPVRRDIFETLATLPNLATGDRPGGRDRGLTAAELADRLDLHVTTIRFHLEHLVDAGLVDAYDERAGVGRPRRRFTVSPRQAAEVSAPDAYRLIADVLADAWVDAGHLTPDEAGRRWMLRHADLVAGSAGQEPPARTPGAWLAKLGILVDLLERWGYAPAVTTTEGGRTAEIALHSCPLRELAVRNPPVACGVHRGILRGALAAIGEADADVRLTPFAGPAVCVARISTSTDFSRPERP